MREASPLLVGAVIVAAGASSRMRGVDKIFAPLAGRPLIAWTLDAFQECDAVHRIAVVLSQGNLERGHALLARGCWPKVEALLAGGRRRQDSVRAGLEALEGCRWAVIHDGARPFVTGELIEEGLKEARISGAAVAAVRAKDTVKAVDSKGVVLKTLPREDLWLVQTPQVFDYELIRQAHRLTGEHVTDDAMLVERQGRQVRVYPGSYENIKVTTSEDLAVAEFLAVRRKGP